MAVFVFLFMTNNVIPTKTLLFTLVNTNWTAFKQVLFSNISEISRTRVPNVVATHGLNDTSITLQVNRMFLSGNFGRMAVETLAKVVSGPDNVSAQQALKHTMTSTQKIQS